MGSLASFSLIQFMQQTAAEPSDPTAVFGGLFGLVLVLDVINTLIALYFLWRIWFRGPRRSDLR
jgi:hypothetical protein